MDSSLYIDDLGNTKPMPEHATRVFRGQIFDTYQWEQQMYDGSVAVFEALRRNDSVHTIGVLPNGHILLTEDTQPQRGPVITPAGGMVETGETPDTAARREFLEETGYAIGTLIPWHYYRAATKAEWFIFAYVGRDLQHVGKQALEAGEKVKLLTFSFDDFLELGRGTKLRDRILRTILLEALLDVKKRDTLYQLFYD